jgi:hypothetical protein
MVLLSGEALLGTAWAWIKVNQPNVALKTIEKLFQLSGVSSGSRIFSGERLFFDAFKEHQEAVSALEQCIAACIGLLSPMKTG